MDIKISPIGIYKSERKQSYSLPRQPDHDSNSNFSEEPGLIQLNEGSNFQQALIGLDGFSHLWVIYLFHHNQHWKPMTLPPRGSPHKIGVFGTRSPYRPNPIGISCLKIKKIEGLNIFVEGADLMDETPILDVKPYITYSDSIPKAKQGWLENIEEEKHLLKWDPNFLNRLGWLKSETSADETGTKTEIYQLQDFIQRQLEFAPSDERRKRVFLKEDYFILAYRTWRIQFRLNEELRTVLVESLFSGYTDQDLLDSSDPYKDKKLHIKFKSYFVEIDPE